MGEACLERRIPADARQRRLREARRPEGLADATGAGEQMAQRLYSAGRSRQHFIEKYGSRLGAVLWQMRQSRFVSHFLGKYESAKPAEKAEDVMSAASITTVTECRSTSLRCSSRRTPPS